MNNNVTDLVAPLTKLLLELKNNPGARVCDVVSERELEMAIIVAQKGGIAKPAYHRVVGMVSRHAHCQFELAKALSQPFDNDEECSRARGEAKKAERAVFDELKSLRQP